MGVEEPGADMLRGRGRQGTGTQGVMWGRRGRDVGTQRGDGEEGRGDTWDKDQRVSSDVRAM